MSVPSADEVPWDQLSAEGTVILQAVVLPLWRGLSYAEIATRNGQDVKWVSARIREFKSEIRRLQSE